MYVHAVTRSVSAVTRGLSATDRYLTLSLHLTGHTIRLSELWCDSVSCGETDCCNYSSRAES